MVTSGRQGSTALSLLAFACLFLPVSLVTPAQGQSGEHVEKTAPAVETEQRPVLPADSAEQVKELTARIEELTKTGTEESLAEALTHAEEILALRLKHQGPAAGWMTATGEPAEWYEVGDARREVEDLELRIGLDLESRARLSEADAAEESLDELRRQGKRDEALELAKAQLATYRELLGEEHLNTADGLANVGKMLSSKGDYSEAEPYYRDSLALNRRLLGDDHPAVATSMNNLAILVKRMGQYDEAETLYREALVTMRRLLGERDLEVASTLNNLAQLLRVTGDYTAAEPLYRESLAIRRERLGNEHLKVAASLTNLAGLLVGKGEYARAEALAREALAIRRSQLGDHHTDVAGSLDTLGLILKRAGDYDAAEPMSREALAIRRALLGNEHPQVALSLFNLAALLEKKGDYDEAEVLLREALAINRQRFGPRHPSVAANLTNLGRIAEARGKYAAAELMLLEALAIQREFYGDEHRHVATSLSALAGVLESKGDYAASESLCREALAMRRKLLGDEHQLVAVSLNNLALLLENKGDHDTAEFIQREALAINRKILGDEHAEVATCLQNLGRILSSQGDFATTEQLYREALSMRRHLLGDQHPVVAANLFVLASFLRLRGDFAAAEPMCRQALAMHRRLQGDDHPEVILTMNGLARLLYDRGDFAAAEEYWAAASDRFETARLRIGYGGLARVQFTKRHSPLRSLAACQARNGKISEAWKALESGLARGLLDMVSAREARPLEPSERTREQALINRMIILDERIGSLSATAAESEEIRSRLDALRNEQEILQAELIQFETKMTAKYGAAAGEVYELPRIQAQMSSDSALLAWVDIKGNPLSVNPGGEHWACLVKKHGAPIWIRLPGSGKNGTWTDADDEAPDQVRQAMSENSREKSMQRKEHLVRRLLAQRLAPLEPHLAGIHHLIVLPAGRMAGIPLEVLTDDYTVSYAPSGTIYAWLKEKKRKPGQRRSAATGPPSLLAVGDPIFSSPDEPREPAAPGVTPSRQLLNEKMSTLRGQSFAPLPASRQEVEAIAALFYRPEEETRPTILLGSGASEQRLDALAQSDELKMFRYLHLATHGVMDDRRAMNSAMILTSGSRADSVEQAVAGQEIFDGRLTAGQIVRTWKLDADLVTLSGCGTALGRKSGGEGFLGFSQALFVAGSQSLLLSLWKVDDRATMLLMTRFYENILGIHDQPRLIPGGSEYPAGVPLPKAEALREAKTWLRTLTVDQLRTLEANRGDRQTTDAASGPTTTGESSHFRPYQDPQYWASFILIGNPD